MITVQMDARLTKEPETKTYGSEGKTLTSVSLATNTGFGDNKNTLFYNCTCFGKSGEAMAKYLNKGDQIFISGVPTQKKVDDKVYHGITINDWSFGAKVKGGSNDTGKDEQGGQTEGDGNPFSDDDIPF